MYADRVDNVRKFVAISIAVCGLGFGVSVNIGPDALTVILGLATIAALIAAFGLCIEYLIRSRIETRSGRTTSFQFTVAELLFATTVIASVLGVFRILGGATIALLIVVVLLLACGLETVRLRRAAEKDGASSDGAQQMPSNSLGVDPPNSHPESVNPD